MKFTGIATLDSKGKVKQLTLKEILWKFGKVEYQKIDRNVKKKLIGK